jgi:hypothetical protein
MRKLTIESLHVASFETASAAPGACGTVQGYAAGPTGVVCPSFNPCLPTFNVEICA